MRILCIYVLLSKLVIRNLLAHIIWLKVHFWDDKIENFGQFCSLDDNKLKEARILSVSGIGFKVFTLMAREYLPPFIPHICGYTSTSCTNPQYYCFPLGMMQYIQVLEVRLVGSLRTYPVCS